MGLYASCRLTAKTLCTLCQNCVDAKVPGAAFSVCAMPDGKQSGNYQAHLDKVLPSPTHMAMLEVPMTERRGGARVVKAAPVRLAHECLEDEVREDSATFGKLHSDPTTRDPCARREGSASPIPCGIYVDGVTYQQSASGRQDSITGIWLVNLLSGKRHLLSALRHSDECACGCRGWCSTYPLLAAVRHQFISMAEGQRPTTALDGSPLPQTANTTP
eukprot:6175537-Pyramimonas_sp.AAC.1